MRMEVWSGTSSVTVRRYSDWENCRKGCRRAPSPRELWWRFLRRCWLLLFLCKTWWCLRWPRLWWWLWCSWWKELWCWQLEWASRNFGGVSWGYFRCLFVPGRWYPEKAKRPSSRLELKASLWWCLWSFIGVRRLAELSSSCCCSCTGEKLTSAASRSGASRDWFAPPLESLAGSFHHNPSFLASSWRGVDPRPEDNRKSYY